LPLMIITAFSFWLIAEHRKIQSDLRVKTFHQVCYIGDLRMFTIVL